MERDILPFKADEQPVKVYEAGNGSALVALLRFTQRGTALRWWH